MGLDSDFINWLTERRKQKEIASSYSKHSTEDTWPEHIQVEHIFITLQTQWNFQVGMGGVVYMGLIYSEFWNLLDRFDVEKEEQRSLFEDIQHIEIAARHALNEKNR